MAIKEKARNEIEEQYKWDLSTIYKTEEDYNKDFKKAEKLVKKITKYQKTLMNSDKNLLETLKIKMEASRLIEKLYMYAHLNSDSDTTDVKYQTMYNKVLDLDSSFDKATSFVTPALLKHKYKEIEEFYKEEPRLSEYERLLKDIYRFKEHTLSEDEERIISALNQSLAASEKIYDTFTNSDMALGTIIDENNDEIELTDSNYGIYIRSKNRDVRKRSFDKMYESYSNYKNTIAKTLSGDVKANIEISKLRNYPSALEASLHNDNINIEVYNNLIATVNSNLEPLYKYFKLKKEILALGELHLYDTYVNLIEQSDTKYEYEKASKLVRDALSVLGDDYSKKIDRAFDEGWIDVYSNVGKVSGAYSSGGYDTNSFILLNHNDNLTSTSTLAHELGHSMHSTYSKENNPYQYSHYKIFVAEVASTVNELLLAKYMLKNSNNDEEKMEILNELLDKFKGTIYRRTMFAEFERNIYKLAEDGEILTHELLSNIYYELNKKYFGPDVIVDDIIKYEWMRVPHFYYNFYVYKYATGLSAACYIADSILTGKENALENYIKFLKTGGSDYPLEELKIAGVDMTKKEVVESAIKMFSDTLDEFEALYRKNK